MNSGTTVIKCLYLKLKTFPLVGDYRVWHRARVKTEWEGRRNVDLAGAAFGAHEREERYSG